MVAVPSQSRTSTRALTVRRVSEYSGSAWPIVAVWHARAIKFPLNLHEAVYDHFGWRVQGRAWEIGPARLAETHEFFHRQLDDTTAFGGLTSTFAALGDALPDVEHWRSVHGRLLAMSDLVHETFAVGASLLTTQRAIKPIDGYPAYDRHVRAAHRLVGPNVHPWVALGAVRAAAMACMQSRALALAAEAGASRFDPSRVPPLERPNNRFAELLAGRYRSVVQQEQEDAARAHATKPWWRPADGVMLAPDSMDGEASTAWGLMFDRLFHAAADVIRSAGGLPVVELDGQHENLRTLLADARALAPMGLTRLGSLVEAPGGELLHGGPLDGQVVELSSAPRRAVVLPYGAASATSGEGQHRHVFVVLTTPRRICGAHFLEGVPLPEGDLVAGARTTVFDGDALDSVLYLLVDRPDQLGDLSSTFVSIVSSALAADPETANAWLRSADLERASLVMDTPVTAALRRWCVDGARFHTETRCLLAGDDKVWIIAGRVERPEGKSPLVVIPTSEFGARWFEAARTEDTSLRNGVVDDPDFFERNASHLDIVLTHMLVEERYVGTGSWRA